MEVEPPHSAPTHHPPLTGSALTGSHRGWVLGWASALSLLGAPHRLQLRPGMTRSELPPIGQLLRRLRTAAALSQEELAERAGLSVRALSDLERGVHQAPRLETVRLLATALDLGEHDRVELLAAARPEWQVSSSPRAARSSQLVRLPLPLTRLIGREQ